MGKNTTFKIAYSCKKVNVNTMCSMNSVYMLYKSAWDMGQNIK